MEYKYYCVKFMYAFYMHQLFIAFLLSIINNCFLSLHSHPMLYITILITIVLVACLIKKLFYYHLPTRGRVGVNLGDADMCQTYL